MTMLRLGGFILISLGYIPLTACTSDNNYAPVVDINQSVKATIIKKPVHKRFAVTALKTQAEPRVVTAIPSEIILPLSAPTLTNARLANRVTDLGWMWPAVGKVLKPFSSVNKGVNIGGYLGQPVYAAASGKVVYSGSGLPGYGNLVILEHPSLFLSAYAHNNKLFVRTGDQVKKGQMIAEMGKTESNAVMLHFEIRHNGRPIDPTLFLKNAMR